MKTIKNIPVSTLTAADAEQAHMLISGINDRTDFSDRIPFTQVRTFIIGQLSARVDAIEAALGMGSFGVPVGVISMWFGSEGDLPQGWAICNGQTVERADGSVIQTPDLRDRVVIGAGSVLAQGITGGALEATTDTEQAGNHTHGINGGGHFHSIAVDGTIISEVQMPAHSHKLFATRSPSEWEMDTKDGFPVWASQTGGDSEYSINAYSVAPTRGNSQTIGGNQPHSHGATITGDGAHGHGVGESGNHSHPIRISTMQPAMGLHYIMKV